MRYRTRPRTAYLAGRFDRKSELQEAEVALREHNILPGTRWLHVETDMRGAPQESVAEWAFMDFEDVLNADMLIFFSEDLSEDATTYTNDIEPPGNVVPAVWARGGRHVEYGIALGNGISIAVIGPKENIFHHFAEDRFVIEHFDTLEAFIAWYDANNVLPEDAEMPDNEQRPTE